VAIGVQAGQTSQNQYAIAIGVTAGQTSQGIFGIAIGPEAALSVQGRSGIAIGFGAGKFNQGQNAIAIGLNAGVNNQHQSTIVLNASGVVLDTVATSSFYVSPIRDSGDASGPNVLSYNTTTKEVYAIAKTFVIDHPQDKDKYLVHACLEGPEAGVYYRGTTQVLDRFVEVLLPDYVSAFANNFTVNVTHVFNEDVDTEPKTYAATPVKNNSFRIYGPEGTVSWVVYGKRGHIEVEPLKTSVDVKGSGPYKWI
jgi:hypothetical protein